MAPDDLIAVDPEILEGAPYSKGPAYPFGRSLNIFKTITRFRNSLSASHRSLEKWLARFWQGPKGPCYVLDDDPVLFLEHGFLVFAAVQRCDNRAGKSR
jgi:hypothetical protein